MHHVFVKFLVGNLVELHFPGVCCLAVVVGYPATNQWTKQALPVCVCQREEVDKQFVEFQETFSHMHHIHGKVQHRGLQWHPQLRLLVAS